MKTVCRLACSMLLICFATVIIAGCAKTPPKAEPVMPPATEATNEPKKIIVARVNDAVLTMDALVTMMNNLPDLPPPASETLEERKKRALDGLVLLELAYQRATMLGLNANDSNIETGLNTFKLNLGGEEEYAAYLATHNMTDADARAEVERGLTINHIYSKEVLDQVTVPEENLKAEYEREKDRYMKPEKVIIIDVYLLKNEDKVSQKKAKELLKMIKADPKHDPWKLVLDGTFNVKNTAVRKDRDKALYDAARKLKPQGLSGVVRDSQGFLHIIKLTEFSPERHYTYEEAKAMIIEKLNPPFIEKRTHEWEQELKKDAKITLMLDSAEKQEEKKP
jgi:parvulin-like peptidyl-prolyl isomerase